MASRTTGMILGKFLPPHRGHQYLGDFAQNYVDDLTVLVCSIQAEPIPGKLRHDWVSSMFPNSNVVHIEDENPQEPSEHPDFWEIWIRSIRRVMPTGPDYVFASESYGYELAQRLGAHFVPVDQARELIEVSGTMVRTDPMKYWEYLPEVVRPHFVKRVCVFGPESTGKTTLARNLAERFNTRWVHEYARPLLEPQGGECFEADIPRIARGQIAAEDALARQANRVLICDTDVLTTTIWSQTLFGNCPAWIQEESDRRVPDLYLLLDVDVPWVDDAQRHLPHIRREFWSLCRQTLAANSRKWIEVSGDWESRLTTATQAVESLIRYGGS